MNKSPDETELLARIASLELKVSLLLGMVAIQLLLVLLGWITGLFGSTFWILTMLVAVGTLGYVFRQQIPGWSGMLIRYVFSRSQGGKSEDRIA